MPATHASPSRRGLIPNHPRLAHLSAVWLLAAALAGPAQAGDAPVAPVVGDTPPAYAGQRLDGSAVNIQPGDGKAYVVSFWASWCGPCLKELPVLVNIQSIAGADHLQVVAVNVEDRARFRELDREIRKLGLTSAFDPDKAAQKSYQVKSYPHMVIVGRDGRISAIRKGFGERSLDSLAQDLNTALAAVPPNAATAR